MANIPRQPIYVKYWPRPWPQAEFYYRVSSIQLLHSIFPPVNQEIWPLPVQPPRIYAQSYSSPYALIVPPVAEANPFAQTDWPAAKRYSPINIQWTHTNLVLGQPPPRIDKQIQPGPHRLPHRFYAQSYSTPYVLTIGVAIPFVQIDWPSPKQPPRVYAQSYATNFQLLSSIRPPNRLSDWPQIIPPYRVYAQSYAPSIALTFVQPVPFVQSNWPNPIQPYRVYAEARSAFVELLRSIKPFAQTDWPRPKLTFGGLTWTQGPVALQLQQPFSQDDWPIPIQPYRVYAIVRRADIGLLHSIQPPNEQSNWPISIQPGRVYAKSQSTPATLFTAPVKPSHQDDWPIPIQPGRVYAEARRADVGLLHSIKPPNNQPDWPLPRLVRRLGETIAQPPHPAMLAKPFNQPDWPNPKLVLLPTSAQGWINRVNLALQIAPLPLNQFDWPIPKPSRPASDRRTYIQAAPILLGIPPQPKPFKQDIWPPPIQPIFPIWARQVGQGAWPTIGLIAPPVPRVSTEARFRSPLQDDDARPDVPDQRRPGISAIRRPSNESPSSARDRSWRYE